MNLLNKHILTFLCIICLPLRCQATQSQEVINKRKSNGVNELELVSSTLLNTAFYNSEYILEILDHKQRTAITHLGMNSLVEKFVEKDLDTSMIPSYLNKIKNSHDTRQTNLGLTLCSVATTCLSYLGERIHKFIQDKKKSIEEKKRKEEEQKREREQAEDSSDDPYS